jgi:hypothetical protein
MIEYIRQASGSPIRRICVTLGVPRSSYYHAAVPTPTQPKTYVPKTSDGRADKP